MALQTMLDRLSQLALIGACVVLSVIAVMRYVSQPAPAAAQAGSLNGTTVASELLPNAARTTMLVAVNSKCVYCQASMPFYQRLQQTARTSRSGTTVLFASYEEVEVTESSLRQHGISGEAIVLPREFPIRATPTLLLIRDGKVVESWVGKLNEDQERLVLERIT